MIQRRHELQRDELQLAADERLRHVQEEVGGAAERHEREIAEMVHQTKEAEVRTRLSMCDSYHTWLGKAPPS